MAETPKGIWASLADGLVKALEKALAPVVGWLARDLVQQLREKENENESLRKELDALRRTSDPAVRERVRERFKDPG